MVFRWSLYIFGALILADVLPAAPLDIAPDYIKILSNVGVLGVLILLISKTLPAMMQGHRDDIAALQLTITGQTQAISAVREELARQTEILRRIDGAGSMKP